MECHHYTTVEVRPGYSRSTSEMYTVADADIVTITPKVVIEVLDRPEDPMLTVNFDWSEAGVDRPNTGGYGLAPDAKGRALAKRLADANDAGVLHDDHRHITRDDAGQTYVCCHRRVMGKYMNADLRRLGF